MATIRAAIQIYDQMSRPLQAMSRGVNTLINAMETAQGTFEHGFDSSVLQQVREDIAEATVGFDQMEQQIRQADTAQNRFNDRIQEGSDSAGGLLQQIKNIAVAVGGLTALKKLVNLSDSMASTRARLNLIVDDGGSVGELEKKIMASAQRSRASYLTTAQAVSQMGLMTADAFSGNDELIAFTETLNKQFVIAGAQAQQIEAATLQLTQAMASGVLRGEELNSVFENAQPVVQSIADYLGVSIGEIRAMAEEGQITADVVKNAVLSSANEVNKTFENMPITWGQVFTMASNVALQVLQPLLNGINWLANNISIIGPLVLGLGAAFAVFQIAAHWTQIAAAATAIYHGVVNFLSIGFGILTGNTAAASAAVFTFNSALLANPIVWVVMLIAVLIAALYAGVAAYNKFTGAGVSATGIIGGAFAVLGAHILNTFIIPLQNAFAMIANFIGNVFNDPVAAVKVLFYDMCLTVIGYIRNLAQGIEDLINKIPGVTVDITSGLDNFYVGLEQAQQKVKDEAGWVEYVQKMDFIDYSEAASAGYDFGKGIADKISGAFSLDGTDAFNLGNTLDGIYGNTGDTAGNTAAMSDALDIAEEDLAYMRDIAEQEAINRFTTAEIHVEQHNENHISSDTDLDGIMDAWANDFAEKLDVSEEGVHE
ncbi:MAG: tape measure protein [Lawsonibacter sp.]|nr:tape measure protein [bacterium 210917-SL.2.15]